jgi:hypothetical protein
MRRPLAALLLGAVSLTGIAPLAAGAADLPKVPFTGPRKPVIRLACDVIRPDGAPAVSCSWSTPPLPRAAHAASVGGTPPIPRAAATDAIRPEPYVFRLGRVERAGRTVVHKGSETTFVDTTVEPGRKYGYRVQALNRNGRPVAGSGTVRVAVPDPGPDQLRFGCSAEERTVTSNQASPAVACRWSASERRTLDHDRLFRLDLDGKSWRQVVYRGKDTSFVDERVEAGHKYRYRVQAIDGRGHVIGISDVADVAIPPVVIVDRPVKPTPVPDPKPEPINRPVKPLPAPEPEPMPTPKARPLPEPLPAPAPTPRPQPDPVPVPERQPVPVVARMKLACAPQRVDTTDNTTDRMTFAPAEPVVVCEWAAPSDLKVSGYQLWRADRPDGTKQVVFRSVDATRFVDRAVSAGHSYVYVVRALDANGRVIAQSDGVPVSFPAPSTDTAA